MFDFSDHVVMVTGAAGNLGSAVARAFQAAGANLVLVDRAADRLPRLFPDLVDSPHHFLATSVDLTDVEAVETTVFTWIGGNQVRPAYRPAYPYIVAKLHVDGIQRLTFPLGLPGYMGCGFTVEQGSFKLIFEPRK